MPQSCPAAIPQNLYVLVSNLKDLCVSMDSSHVRYLLVWSVSAFPCSSLKYALEMLFCLFLSEPVESSPIPRRCCSELGIAPLCALCSVPVCCPISNFIYQISNFGYQTSNICTISLFSFTSLVVPSSMRLKC